MKAGLFITALVQLAAAQPHRFHHQHLHEKRDVVTKVEVVTATAPDVVVFVNQNGEPVSTSYVNAYLRQKHGHKPTSASSQAVETPAAEPVESSAEPTYAPAPVEPSSAAPVVEPTSKTSTSVAAATSSSETTSGSSKGLGVTYSPYNADGTCKSLAQVQTDFEHLDGYSLVRLYGTDCNQLNTIGPTAIAKGMKLFAGVYDITQVASQVAQIVAFAAGDWQHFDTISVGNELINSGRASVAQVVSAVNTARTLLKAAGFTGKVVTVDTWVATLNNPELCQCSDFAAINAHAFFNSDLNADGAGTYVANIVDKVKAACGKNVVVTESGWPSQGQSNGRAVPSKENQATAVSSLKAAMDPSSLILFTAYNDFWKQNFAGSFEAEHYWGIYGTSSA